MVTIWSSFTRDLRSSWSFFLCPRFSNSACFIWGKKIKETHFRLLSFTAIHYCTKPLRQQKTAFSVYFSAEIFLIFHLKSWKDWCTNCLKYIICKKIFCETYNILNSPKIQLKFYCKYDWCFSCGKFVSKGRPFRRSNFWSEDLGFYDWSPSESELWIYQQKLIWLVAFKILSIEIQYRIKEA